jgi:CRP/FNR family transcriptional regulator, anaerobic regulatory protein
MPKTLLTLAQRRRSLDRGAALYRADDAFEALYVVAAGSFKSRVVLRDGRDQVVGFYLPGDVLGLDGIATGHHQADVAALQESEVWVVPRERLDEDGTREQLPRLLAQELGRGHGTIMLLGALRAPERTAAFLLDLARRQGLPGMPASVVRLPMSRHDIGRHLGLTLETVSRMLSRLQDAGLIRVGTGRITILDFDGLAAERPCPMV